MSILEAVEAVEQVETYELQQTYLKAAYAKELSLEKASKRVPEHLKHTHPYSVNALWTFYLDTEHQPEGPSCKYCEMFDGQTFTGDMLRKTFPDHKWVGDDIYANVHMTLWGKDGTCGCLLIREDEKWGPEVNLSLWSSLGTDWTETKFEEDE